MEIRVIVTSHPLFPCSWFVCWWCTCIQVVVAVQVLKQLLWGLESIPVGVLIGDILTQIVICGLRQFTIVDQQVPELRGEALSFQNPASPCSAMETCQEVEIWEDQQ